MRNQFSNLQPELKNSQVNKDGLRDSTNSITLSYEDWLIGLNHDSISLSFCTRFLSVWPASGLHFPSDSNFSAICSNSDSPTGGALLDDGCWRALRQPFFVRRLSPYLQACQRVGETPVSARHGPRPSSDLPARQGWASGSEAMAR